MCYAEMEKESQAMPLHDEKTLGLGLGSVEGVMGITVTSRESA